MEIPVSDIPYLKDHPKDGRIRPLMNFYDHSTKEWSFYQPRGEDKVIRIVPVDCSTGIFMSSSAPDKDRDIEIPLLTFMLQHFPTLESFDAFDRLYSDLENALSNIEKQRILFGHYKSTENASYFEVVRTEIEYALFNLRSFYDLLNRFVITFFGNHTVGGNKIPDSFRRIAQQTVDDLTKKYGFPTVLAQFYQDKQDEFKAFRDIRDGIGHHGLSPETIYKLEEGFGIASYTSFAQTLEKYDILDKLSPRETGITSLLALIALTTKTMFDTLEDFTEAFKTSFKELPTETAPGYRVFARLRLISHYRSIPAILEDPWDTSFYAEAGALIG